MKIFSQTRWNALKDHCQFRWYTQLSWICFIIFVLSTATHFVWFEWTGIDWNKIFFLRNKDMALLVHLKTVANLRGKGDRIAKVTFRGMNTTLCLLYHIVKTYLIHSAYGAQSVPNSLPLSVNQPLEIAMYPDIEGYLRLRCAEKLENPFFLCKPGRPGLRRALWADAMNSLRSAIAVCQKHFMSSSPIHDRIKKMQFFSAISRLALIANKKVCRWCFWSFLIFVITQESIVYGVLHWISRGIAFTGPPVSRLHFTFYSPNGVTLPDTACSHCAPLKYIDFFPSEKKRVLYYSLRRMSRGGATPNLENIVFIRKRIWGALASHGWGPPAGVCVRLRVSLTVTLNKSEKALKRLGVWISRKIILIIMCVCEWESNTENKWASVYWKVREGRWLFQHLGEHTQVSNKLKCHFGSLKSVEEHLA